MVDTTNLNTETIDFGVYFWFRCPEHGRFNIKNVYPDMGFDELLHTAQKVKEVSCPTCSTLCKPCTCKGDNKQLPELPTGKPATFDITKLTDEKLSNMCPNCVIGTVCAYCGKDLQL
jgi:hypothetical protein